VIVICDTCFKEAEVTELGDREWLVKCHDEEQLYTVSYGEAPPSGKLVWSNLSFTEDRIIANMAANHIDNLFRWGKETRLYEHLLRNHDPNRGTLRRVNGMQEKFDELIDTLIWLRDG
jgi:hypothetical protein